MNPVKDGKHHIFPTNDNSFFQFSTPEFKSKELTIKSKTLQ